MSLVSDRGEKKGLLGKLKGFLGLADVKEYSWETMIESLIARLKDEQQKFDELEYRTKKRAEELFQRIVDNVKLYNSPAIKEEERRTYQNLAKMYAEEVYELKNFLKAIMFTKISFERVIQRLETINDYKDFQAALGPISRMLAGVKNEISAIFPKAGETLDEINRNITDMMLTTSNSMAFSVNQSFIVNEDVDKILQEAWKKAELDVEKVLPEPTKMIGAQYAISNDKGPAKKDNYVEVQKDSGVKNVAPQKEAVAAQVRPRINDISEIEAIILREIKASNGKLNVGDIVTKYNLDKDRVYAALISLQKKGKIEVKFGTK